MILIEKAEVMNFKGAFRGMRNPLESWEKSDSVSCNEYCEKTCAICKHKEDFDKCIEVSNGEFVLGINDLTLAQKLVKAGSDHRKFMRQIMVSVDITAPLYWWKEFDTYKVGTVANSTSTMHMIHKKEFVLDDFSTEHMMELSIKIMQETVIPHLNLMRLMFNEHKSNKDGNWNSYWYDMIQLLPSSYNQMRTVTLNYEVLRNIYFARKSHKLTEWHVLCDWIKSLPYGEELICYEG